MIFLSYITYINFTDKVLIMKEIYRLIRRLGIHSNLSGYHFLARAVELVADDNSLLMGMSGRLYSKIADDFHTSSNSIDRNLRTVVHMIWDRSYIHNLEELAGYTIDYKPSSGEVIDVLAAYYNHYLRKIPNPGEISADFF